MRQHTQRVAAASMLLAAACQLDTTAAPTPTNRPPSAVRAAASAPATLAATADVAPQTLVMFPSIDSVPTFGPGPNGYFSVGSLADVDRAVTVTSSNPAVVSVPVAQGLVLAGSDRGAFQVVPHIVSAPTTVTISIMGAGVTQTANMTVYPQGATLPPPTLGSIITRPTTVAAGSPSSAVITLTSPAPPGGLLLVLFTKLPLSAQIPATATVPPGAVSVTVPITTSIGFPNSTTSVQISAAQGRTIVATGVNVVTGNVPPVYGIASIRLSQNTVVGGGVVQATVTMNAPAPDGGTVLTLVSTDTTAATVPTTALVPAGATATSFAVVTRPTVVATSSNIAAGFDGFLATTLNILPTASAPPPVTTPPSTGPLAAPSLLGPAADARVRPGTAITFDWSDVAGAASYTIQIDDTDGFPAPLVATQTVAVSQLSTATLPTRRLWWRVRANSATGTAGPWSSVRRFEVK